jgi:hypothetical protein
MEGVTNSCPLPLVREPAGAPPIQLSVLYETCHPDYTSPHGQNFPAHFNIITLLKSVPVVIVELQFELGVVVHICFDCIGYVLLCWFIWVYWRVSWKVLAIVVFFVPGSLTARLRALLDIRFLVLNYGENLGLYAERLEYSVEDTIRTFETSREVLRGVARRMRVCM